MSSLRFHNRPTVIERFNAKLSVVVKEADEILWEQFTYVLEDAERFMIPLDRVQDKITFMSRDHSFLS